MKDLAGIKNKIVLLFAALISSFWSYAQDGAAKIDVDINKGGGGDNWYANPIVWVVGIAVFILLLVALLRGNRK